MSQDSSQKADHFLRGKSQELQSVYRKIKTLAELNASLTRHLDATLLPYCQVANLIGNRLILLVANGSIATQIRFQTPDLITKFKQDPKLYKVQDIHCKVRPIDAPLNRGRNKIKKMQPLSKETAEIVEQSAASLTDPTLRAIMERIAKHVKEK